jgi:hypothetical protein
MTGISWPGADPAVRRDAELDAAALVRCTMREDRAGLAAVFRARGMDAATPELALAGELIVIAAHMCWQSGGEAALDEYQGLTGEAP